MMMVSLLVQKEPSACVLLLVQWRARATPAHKTNDAGRRSRAPPRLSVLSSPYSISLLYTKLGCPMLARRRFHILPRGSTLRGAWMMTGMGRYT